VAAQQSSTVVLARAATNAPEFLMVRRHAKSSLGDSYVFPGGVLDASDRAVHEHCTGCTAEEADRVLGVDANGQDYFSAAVRELFEETGVLLAHAEVAAEDLQQARDQLNDGSLRWDDFVTASNARLNYGSLHYFSHWITPNTLPRRYSTRFFIAELPAGQRAVHDGGELTDSCWMTADDVLLAGREGSMSLRFPTLRTLESIAGHESVEALIVWAKSIAKAGVPCLHPQIVERDGLRRIVLDGADGSAEGKL
jgi:8-oxo-dGTP pyrophosphatase MutT (NUDIX family)